MQNSANFLETMHPTNPRPTLAGVIADKAIAYVRANRAGRIFRKALEVITALILGVLALYPAEVLAAIDSLLKLNNFAIPKVSVVAVGFLARKSIIRLFKRCVKLVHSLKVQPDEKLLDNIPVAELSNYLIRNKHFRREGINGVRATFNLNMEKFHRLASKLEENGVLVRGENNGRILASHWSLQSLNEYLSGSEKSKDLAPRFTIHRLGGKIRLDKTEMAT